MTPKTERGRPCETCKHADLHDLENDLLQGVSVRKVSKAYGLSRESVTHHKKNCIPAALAAARRQADENHGQRLIRLMNELLEDLRGLRETVNKSDSFIAEWMVTRDAEAKEAEEKAKGGDKSATKMIAKWRASLQVAREYRATLMDLSKVTGTVQDQITINVHQAPDFLEVKELILRTIEPWPEAHAAMSNALLAFIESKSDAPSIN